MHSCDINIVDSESLYPEIFHTRSLTLLSLLITVYVGVYTLVIHYLTVTVHYCQYTPALSPLLCSYVTSSSVSHVMESFR